MQIKKIVIAVSSVVFGSSLALAADGPIKIGVVTPLSGTYTPI